MSKKLVDVVKTNDINLAKQLIAQGADVNQTDSSGNSLLIVSSANGNAAMVKLLIDAGADINAVDSSMKATALHAAAYLRHPEVMQVLVDHGIDINAQGPYNGYTALHDAVWQNNIEGVKILVKSGANLNIKGNNGATPLELATQSRHKEIVEILKAASS